ncbi:MAG: UpxY family transcription antiterminator [Spirochaetota bacterium]
MRSEACEKYNWYAVHVRSRHEFMVTSSLVKKNVETFLPTVEKLRQWKDRKKTIAFPLFPGYLFVHIPPQSDDILNVLKTRGVVRILGNGSVTPIPDEQIESLKRLVDTKEPIDTYPYLREGQNVRVVSGPLTGATGILVKKESNHMLVLSIDILQKGVCVKINAGAIVAVE